MKDYGFTNWVSEYADYGMDLSRNIKNPEPEGENINKHLNVEEVIKSLKRKALGEKWTKPDDFFGQLQWGEQAGAVRLTFSPYGGLKAVVRKLTHDLEGMPVWICKKVVEIKNFFDERPDTLTFKLQEQLDKIDNEGIDAAKADFTGLERLAIHLASELRRKTTQRIFMYEGIRVVEEHKKYIIHFGVTGMGVQRAGQKRLDQFAVNVEYNNKTGLIKIAGTEWGDVLAHHRWQSDPSQFLEFFCPGQSEDDIMAAILVHFNCY